MWVFDIKHPRLTSSAYGHVEAKTNWGINKASSRPQCRGSVQFPCSGLRYQIVPSSLPCLVPQPLFLGDSLWHLSWLRSLLLNNTTTRSLLDRTCFLFHRSRAMPAFPSPQALNFLLSCPDVLIPILTSDSDVTMSFFPCFYYPIPTWLGGVECCRKEGFFQEANVDSYSYIK